MQGRPLSSHRGPRIILTRWLESSPGAGLGLLLPGVCPALPLLSIPLHLPWAVGCWLVSGSDHHHYRLANALILLLVMSLDHLISTAILLSSKRFAE